MSKVPTDWTLPVEKTEYFRQIFCDMSKVSTDWTLPVVNASLVLHNCAGIYLLRETGINLSEEEARVFAYACRNFRITLTDVRAVTGKM
jgi:hypothetical protein